MVGERQLRSLPHRSEGKVKNSNSDSFKTPKEYLTKCDDNITEDNSNDSYKLLDKTFLCGVNNCGKEYRSKYLYERHFRTIHSEKTLRCDHLGCDYMTGVKDYLRNHM